MRPETEKRVRQAVDVLEYVPRPAAPRTSNRSTSEIIALVLPEMDNAYHGAIADHIVEEAERRGLAVLLCSTRNQRLKEESYIELLTAGKVAGLLYLGSHRSNRRLGAAVQYGFPIVVLDEQLAGVPPVDSVIMDDYAGAFQATSHLLRLGHRRIAFVGGPSELHSVQERYRGCTAALAKADVRTNSQVRLSGPFGEQFGMSAMPHVVATRPVPTAVFAASDLIALGLLAAAETHGVRVPEDLSVVGFDDVRFSEYVRPRLTTIHSPIDRLASIGVEMLVERLGGSTVEARTEVLPVSFVERNSTAAPQAADLMTAGIAAP